MSREIKFRAWLTLSDYDDDGNDKDYHAMLDEVSVSNGGYIGFSVDDGYKAFGDAFERALENGNAYEYEEWCTWERQFNLMQYTGLVDRHGVEIYEGDVIDITRAGGDRGYVPVVFREGIFCLYVKYWVDEYYPLNTYASEHYEVIGNVYENPDLLTNKGESYGTK